MSIPLWVGTGGAVKTKLFIQQEASGALSLYDSAPSALKALVLPLTNTLLAQDLAPY